jgi:hypothetical protein
MAATAEVHLTAKDHTSQAFAAVRKNMDGITHHLRSLKGELLALAGIAGFGVMIESAIETGASIEKLSKKLGASTEALSQFQHVAEVAHVAFDSVTRSFQFLEKNVAAASHGLGPAKQAFQALGVSAKQLKQLKVEDQFAVLADRFREVHNAANKTRLAMQIFGKAGSEMIPLMDGGSAAIRAAREEADRLGLTLTEVGAHHLAEAHEAMVKLKHAFAGLANTLAIQLGPALAKGAEALSVLLPEAVQGTILAFIRLKEVAALALSSVLLGFEHLYKVLGALPGALGQPFREASAAAKVLQNDLFAAVSGYEKELGRLSALQPSSAQSAFVFPAALYTPDSDQGKAGKAAHCAAQKAAREAARAFKAQERVAKAHAQKMTEIFSTVFFSGMESGFKGMVSSFKSSLQQMVSEAAATELTRAVFKSLPSLSGGQGFLGNLLQSAGQAASTFFGGFRASGGDVRAGKGYIVGERGPEFFIPQQNGQIMPNTASKQSVSSAAISIVMHVHTLDAPSFRRSAGQIRADLGLALQQALKRNT